LPAITSAEADDLLRRFATILAPYVAEVLDRPTVSLSPEYDQPTCTVFCSKLGDGVVDRAVALFDHLARRGKISSVDLAALLSLEGPRSIPGALNTPLKRRAKELNLPFPFAGGEGALEYGGLPDPGNDDLPERTYWADRDGIAARMLPALKHEQALRSGTSGRGSS
jgi:hypothetical protein